MKGSFDKLPISFRWTALKTKHIKTAIYTLKVTCLLKWHDFTTTDPQESIPQLYKGQVIWTCAADKLSINWADGAFVPTATHSDVQLSCHITIQWPTCSSSAGSRSWGPA